MSNDPQATEPAAEPAVEADSGGASGRADLERLVDDLDAKVAAEAGDPLRKIAEDSSGDGVDRDGQDAEPPV